MKFAQLSPCSCWPAPARAPALADEEVACSPASDRQIALWSRRRCCRWCSNPCPRPRRMPASWLVIQWRTSNSIIFFLPPSSNSKVAVSVFGVSWSSSNMKWPPMALTLVGILHAQPPARDVHLVDALVARVAVAVIPEPVPVVVEAIARERRARAPGPATDRSARPRAPAPRACGRWCRATCSRARATCRRRRSRPRASSRMASRMADAGAAVGAVLHDPVVLAAPRPRSAAPRRYRASRASRHRRPCPPGSPRWSAACACDWAWRWKSRRSICLPAVCEGR